jgi:hypothetical protein
MKLSAFEEGLPIPEIVPRNNKYNLHRMEVGSCFTVEDYNPEDVQRLRVAVCNYARRNNKKFITRKIEENGKWKLRLWRKS